jgi:hypothetical protein
MAPHPDKCGKCGEAYGQRFGQDYAQFRVTATVYGDPKTVGQQAELNEKRMGGELTQRLWEDQKSKVRAYSGPLPDGARPITDPGETPPWRDGSMGLAPLEKPLDLTKVKDVNKYVRTGEKA